MGAEDLDELLRIIKRNNLQMIGVNPDSQTSGASVPAAVAAAAGVAAVPIISSACSRSPSLLRASVGNPEEDAISRQSVPSRDLEQQDERPPTPDTRPVTPVLDEAWSEAEGQVRWGAGGFVYPPEDDVIPFVNLLDVGSEEEIPLLSAEDVALALEEPLPSDLDLDQEMEEGNFLEPNMCDVVNLMADDELMGLTLLRLLNLMQRISQKCS